MSLPATLQTPMGCIFHLNPPLLAETWSRVGADVFFTVFTRCLYASREISNRRHSVFDLYVSASVRDQRTNSLLARWLTNPLWEFHQIYNLCAVEDRDKLITFWDQKVKGQGHNNNNKCTFYAEACRSTVRLRPTQSWGTQDRLVPYLQIE